MSARGLRLRMAFGVAAVVVLGVAGLGTAGCTGPGGAGSTRAAPGCVNADAAEGSLRRPA